jgi:ferredoxin
MPKIILEREKCIGCGSCAALCAKYFQLAEDGKSQLLGSEKNTDGNYELEINEIGCVREAADACPVAIIHVIE